MASTNFPWKRANVLNSKPTIIRTISSIAIGRFMIFLALIISNLESKTLFCDCLRSSTAAVLKLPYNIQLSLFFCL